MPLARGSLKFLWLGKPKSVGEFVVYSSGVFFSKFQSPRNHQF